MGEEGSDVDQLERAIDKAGMPKEAKEKALTELNKLKMMSPMSAEATVIRNYLDWIIAVPWKKRNKVEFNLQKAEVVLDHDHYGLEKVKERIIEYLAVQQRVKTLKGPIICLVGPPGVGKTSLGQSIANATGRTFIRIALGGFEMRLKFVVTDVPILVPCLVKSFKNCVRLVSKIRLSCSMKLIKWPWILEVILHQPCLKY